MLEFLWPLIRPFAWLARLLRKIARTLLGQLSWTPPYWLQRGINRLHIFRRRRPVLAAGIVLLALLLASGSLWTWRWYQRQPKPHTVSAQVAPIPVTPLEKELKFPPLSIEFSESAARLEDLKNPALQHVRLDPAMPGTWKWTNDRKLAFTPAQDWPADLKYRIIFDKHLFPSHVRMDKLEYDVSTPPFRAEIKSVVLSEDAKEPGVQRIIATVNLSHAVEPGELDKHAALIMVGGSNVFAPNDPAPHFSITYGPHNRQAFLRSSPIVLPANEDWMRVAIDKNLRTAQGGAEMKEAVEQKTLVPSKATAFKIKSVDGGIVRNKEGEPEQMLNVETTGDISTAELAKSLHLYLLPKREPEKTEEETAENADEETASEESESEEEGENTENSSTAAKWANADEITDEILEQATVVKFTAIPTEKEHSRDHHFKFKLEGDGQLYVRIDKGLRARSGYDLAENFANVVPAPELPQEIEIQGDGGLLALERRTKTLHPVARCAVDQVRDRSCPFQPDQPSGQPNRRRIPGARIQTWFLRRGQYLAHRA